MLPTFPIEIRNRKMKILNLLGICISLTFFFGCQISKEARQNSKNTITEMEQQLAISNGSLNSRNVGPVRVNNGSYLGGRTIVNAKGDPLPSKFEQDDGIAVSRLQPVSIYEISRIITRQTQIPIVLARFPTNRGEKFRFDGNSVFGSASLSNEPVSVSNRQNTTGNTANSDSFQNVADGGFPLRFSGRLSTLLDMVAAHFNAVWKYEDGKITINRIVNKIFEVPALPLIATMNFGISTGSSMSGNGSSGGSGTTATTNTVSDIWTEINNGLASIVSAGDSGNAYSIGMSTGIVNVSADPLTIKRVATFLNTMNERLRDQVAINVTVYSVVLRGTEQFKFDVAGFIRKAGNFGIGLGNGNPITEIPSPGGGIGGLGWALLDIDSKFNGTSAFIGALSEQGDVSVVTSASLTTLNSVPVPIQVGQERDYVSQVDVTTNDGVTTTDISTDTVSSGFNLHLVPRVNRNGELTLQFGINISELSGNEDGFDTFTANGQTVQLKRLNQRNFVQQARIPHQKTLVLAGFEQIRSISSNTGIGHPRFPLLGGGQSSSSEREVIVIAITPTVFRLN